jgi:sugar lactone lactonase YvrE
VAFANDGGFYVADTGNVRIQHFTAVGNFADAFADSLGEPRGLAVGPGGEVMVADPRCHCVHLFGPTGGQRAALHLPEFQPMDVACVGDTVWVLSSAPPALLRARLLRGD